MVDNDALNDKVEANELLAVWTKRKCWSADCFVEDIDATGGMCKDTRHPPPWLATRMS